MTSKYIFPCLSCPHRAELCLTLVDQLKLFLHFSSVEQSKIKSLVVRQITSSLLNDLEIGNHGYSLLVSAITLSVMEPDVLQNLSRSLYPRVAAMHHTTASRVERNIRTSIERAWTHGSVRVLTQYFGSYSINPSKGKPTNLQFLLVMNETVRQRLNQFQDSIQD